MSILMMMVPIAILLSTCFLGAFIWAANTGQFDDSVTPAHRVLENENQEENL